MLSPVPHLTRLEAAYSIAFSLRVVLCAGKFREVHPLGVQTTRTSTAVKLRAARDVLREWDRGRWDHAFVRCEMRKTVCGML